MAERKPSVEFKTNVPEFITFPFVDFREGEGQYGKWYMYNVKNRGVDKVMFATESLQAKLVSLGELVDRELEIIKEEDGKVKVWRILENGVELASEVAPSKENAPEDNSKRYRPTQEAMGQRKEMENVMRTKSDYIAKAQASKESSIRMAACGRDAVLIVVSFYKDNPIVMEKDEEKEKFIKDKLTEWRKWLYNNIHTDEPFI